MKLFSHSSPIFPVDDPLKTAEYYRDVLGFDINFKWEDPPTYIVINRDDAVGIHLVKNEGDFTPPVNHASLFIFVHDVDAVYQEYQQSGAEITRTIDNRDYGMRDFDVRDPNGFILVFGKHLS
ncbi:MAG: glyoxalase superfamily protein [Cyclobacteriaceae bacterium]